MFRNTYRVYVFLFEKVEAEARVQYRWKVQFRDNQLELMEVPKEAAERYGGSNAIGQESSSNSPSQNSQTNNRTNTSNSSPSNSSSATPRPN
jgi:hypothetical protein